MFHNVLDLSQGVMYGTVMTKLLKKSPLAVRRSRAVAPQARMEVPRRPRPADDPTSPQAIGTRLMLTRKALGHTTTQMCRLMGSASHGSAYTNYEMGRRRINLDHAFELCRNCSLTLEWIYLGEPRNLPEYLQIKIRELQVNRRSRA